MRSVAQDALLVERREGALRVVSRLDAPVALAVIAALELRLRQERGGVEYLDAAEREALLVHDACVVVVALVGALLHLAVAAEVVVERVGANRINRRRRRCADRRHDPRLAAEVDLLQRVARELARTLPRNFPVLDERLLVALRIDADAPQPGVLSVDVALVEAGIAQALRPVAPEEVVARRLRN